MGQCLDATTEAQLETVRLDADELTLIAYRMQTAKAMSIACVILSLSACTLAYGLCFRVQYARCYPGETDDEYQKMEENGEEYEMAQIAAGKENDTPTGY